MVNATYPGSIYHASIQAQNRQELHRYVNSNAEFYHALPGNGYDGAFEYYVNTKARIATRIRVE